MVKSHSRRRNRQYKFDRIHMLVVFFLLLILLIAWRLFRLQVLEGDFFRSVASDQRVLQKELIAERGNIYTRFGRGTDELQPLAINEPRAQVFAVPNEIDNPTIVTEALAEVIEIDKEVILGRLEKVNDLYEPIAHKVSLEQSDRLNSLGLSGIYTSPESMRVYSLGSIFGGITGFVGNVESKEVGQYGVEQAEQEVLAGKAGFIVSERDPRGYLISLADRTFIPAKHGADIILTIDPNIQSTACRLLDEAVKRYDAVSGSIVIMNPKTGEIGALCVNPSFDPNNYSKVEDINIYRNQVISGAYESGSIFKVITMAAALDAKAVKPNTSYVDEGEVEFKDFTIRNAEGKVYGEQNMSQVLEKSINTGVVFAALETGRKTFRKYVKDFGFGKKTGIEMPTESAGDISSLDKKGEIFLATASYGQGITVTPIQMVQALGVIANNGIMVKPHIISEIIYKDDKKKVVGVQELGQIIKPQTATTLSAMLVGVVEDGYGDRARVPGYYVAGKTGTAQVAGKTGGYSNNTIHSFVGFAPISDPRFVMLVKLDQPQKGRFAASTVAPVFREMSNFLLQYYQVIPER